MNLSDYYFLAFLDTVKNRGEHRPTRTGTDVLSRFGMYNLVYNLEREFPLLSLKKVNFHAALCEILWMIRGKTHIRWLHERGCHIWDAWADENGLCHAIYGEQWRHWRGKDGYIDQLQGIVDTLLTNPYDRRMIVSAWNPADLDNMALPPCHCFMQFYCETPETDPTVHLQVYQRSADLFVGVPFNWVHYGIILKVICHITKMKPGTVTFTYGDMHLYENHMDAVQVVLNRAYELPKFTKPQVHIKEGAEFTLDTVDIEHFELTNYNPLPAIKVDVAV